MGWREALHTQRAAGLGCICMRLEDEETAADATNKKAAQDRTSPSGAHSGSLADAASCGLGQVAVFRESNLQKRKLMPFYCHFSRLDRGKPPATPREQRQPQQSLRAAEASEGSHCCKETDSATSCTDSTRRLFPWGLRANPNLRPPNPKPLYPRGSSC